MTGEFEVGWAAWLATAFVNSLSIWCSRNFFAFFLIWIGWRDPREAFGCQRASPSGRKGDDCVTD